jgi:hypothetical protein
MAPTDVCPCGDERLVKIVASFSSSEGNFIKKQGFGVLVSSIYDVKSSRSITLNYDVSGLLQDVHAMQVALTPVV